MYTQKILLTTPTTFPYEHYIYDKRHSIDIVYPHPTGRWVELHKSDWHLGHLFNLLILLPHLSDRFQILFKVYKVYNNRDNDEGIKFHNGRERI